MVTEKLKVMKNVTVKIPKGVDDGTRIRLSGKGEAGSKGGSSGDLYLFISVEHHNIFKRHGENLYFELPITFTDATLGTSIEVPLIDGGKSKIKIPPGTQHGKQLRLRGKGMPFLKKSIFGDLYIRIITEVPVSLSKKQKELLEEFKKLEDTKSSPIISGFFEKAKKVLGLKRMKKIKIGITGCLGRMGKQIIESSKKDKKIKIVSLTETKLVNKKILGIKLLQNSEKAFKNTSVIIDFTVPKCTLEVLKIAAKLRKKL